MGWAAKKWKVLLGLGALGTLALFCRPEDGPTTGVQNVADVERTLARVTGARMLPGNELELLENGDVFDRIERLVRDARSSVHVLVYIWRGEEGPSSQIGRAVLERRPGVDCRIVIDPFGSLKFDEKLERELTASGCRVLRYERKGEPSPLARNHRKVVVVDGEVGITGGFGIWKSWEGDGRTEAEWRDTAVQVRGPAVRQLQDSFHQSWREAGGDQLPAHAFPQLREVGDHRAAFVSSSPRGDGPSQARGMTEVMVAAARRRLWIANSYFIPDEPLRKLLIERQRDGVEVTVLAPGPVHDVPPVRAAQRNTYASLLEAGIRIFEYQPSMMHAKTMIIDDRWVVIGSTNFDPLSFEQLEEGSLVADAPEIARQLRRHVKNDIRVSKEITKELWRKRDPLPEIGRQAAGFLSDWL